MRRFGEFFGRKPETAVVKPQKKEVSLAQQQADYDAERDAWLDKQREISDDARDLEMVQNKAAENERKGKRPDDDGADFEEMTKIRRRILGL